MMWITSLISGLVSVGADWFRNKREETKVKHEVRLERIRAEKDWDAINAENANNSWKDEWFTVLLSVPLILAFFPDAVPVIEEGFLVLQGMPDFYKAFLGAAVAASFGIKALTKWGK